MDKGAEQIINMALMTTDVPMYLKPHFPVLAYIYICSLVGISKSYIKNANVEVVSEEEKRTKSDKTAISNIIYRFF